MSALGNTGRIENLSERRELSDAAKALLADKAFGHVYKQLRQQWFNELSTSRTPARSRTSWPPA